MDTGKVVAILVAAGSGSRFFQSQQTTAKQFVQLDGRAIFLWSLEVLSAHPRIEQIVVVTVPDMIADVQTAAGSLTGSIKIQVTSGGATRQESVFNGLRALGLEPNSLAIVLVHDAARPFLTREIIDATIRGAEDFGACTAAIAPSDTIKKIAGDQIVETLDRGEHTLVQTPQAARFDWLLAAHGQAANNGLATTDDAAVLQAAGRRVHIVPGSPYNLKITRPEDMILAQALSGILSRHRI